MTEAEQLHEHACHAGWRLAVVTQDLAVEGLPAEAITAALLALAVTSRIEDQGRETVVAWLEGVAAVQRSIAPIAATAH